MSLPTGHVLVGVDGTESARTAAVWAAGEANARSIPLRLVCAFTSPSMIYPALGLQSQAIDRSAQVSAEQMLAELAGDLAAQFADLRVETRLRSGHPVAVLRDESDTAVLTVVGSHGSHQFAEALLGSVAVRIAGRAGSPLVVVRTATPGTPPPIRGPVVVGVDGSAQGSSALGFAFEEAARRSTSLVAVHSWNERAVQQASAWVPFEVKVPALADAARQQLHKQLEQWTTAYPNVDVREVVSTHHPVAALLGLAAPDSEDPAQLLVAGRRGSGGFRRLVLGSVSSSLIAYAACPVAVINDHVDGPGANPDV